MATLRWEFYEEKPSLSRADIDVESLRQETMYTVEEFPPYDLEYEQGTVFRPYPFPEEVFAPIAGIQKTDARTVKSVMYAEGIVEKERIRGFQR